MRGMKASLFGPREKRRSARRRSGRYPTCRVKQAHCYDLRETATLLGVHPNTVRHWLKRGLESIDSRRPVLIHGSSLKSFILTRRKDRRRKCRIDELFCFRCRAPRTVWGGVADVAMKTEKIAKVTALCSACGTEMHRTVRRTDISRIGELIDLRMMPFERLEDRAEANANCDFEKDRIHAEIEPAE
jgi:hypothetical protein